MESVKLNFAINIPNLKDIPFDKYEKNFTFILKGKRYETNRFFADILSPIVRKMHFSDESADEFNINDPNNILSELTNGNSDTFEEFLNSFSLENAQLDVYHQEAFSRYFYVLGNVDNYLKMQENYLKELNIETSIPLLLRLQKYGTLGTDHLSIEKEIINFIASNFDSIDKTQLMEVSNETLFEIFESEEFKVSDEDSVLDFILSKYETDRSSSILFSKVYFTNISKKYFRRFVESFNFDDIDRHIWNSLCSSYEENIKISKNSFIQETNNYEIFVLDHVNGNEFNGIMNYLTSKTNGNIHTNKTIEINSNSIYRNNQKFHPKALVYFNNDVWYTSNDNRLATICFDFKDKLIQPNEYSIKSCKNGPNGPHLKSWVVEVSKDGETWSEVDSHENDPALNGSLIVSSFKIQKPVNDFYRFIRLRQTGNSWWNHQNKNRLTIRRIEFYGKLKIPYN